ncbi:hypothetical protein SUNI508_02415 [Seiridium unicorne]|uniref:BZIP domain-containing protein n=1 Tax=Seiridium unicorne TaxID=138068 RepID=A0ABR2UIF9_9PEZI
MPRKVRIPLSRDESRQAQQRSRARHRDYVASLERRVAEFEQQGVQATVDMQRAARVVAVKNEKLLALLALHGVHQPEIDAFLAMPDVIGATSAGGAQTQPLLSPPSTMTAPAASRPLPIVAEPTSRGTSEETMVPDRPMEGSRSICNNASDCRPANLGLYQTKQSVCNPLLKQSAAGASAEQSHNSRSSGEVTSCETAASIIVNLRGNGDVAEARQVLGCTDNAACSVKNTHLFQLMNELP